MAIHVRCPNPACGKEFDLKNELAGKTVKCNACQGTFTVPASPPVIASPAPGGAKQSHAVPPSPEPRTPSPDPLVGQKLGHYLVESKLDKNMWAKMWVSQRGEVLKVETSFGLTMLADVLSDQSVSPHGGRKAGP